MDKQETKNIIGDLMKALLIVFWVTLIILPLAINLILVPLDIVVEYWGRVVMSIGLCIITGSIRSLH